MLVRWPIALANEPLDVMDITLINLEQLTNVGFKYISFHFL